MTERRVFLNGVMVPYGEARIPVQSCAVKFGASVFEGLRAYWSDATEELYVFRLEDHVGRLLSSLRLTRMQHEFTREFLVGSVLMTLQANRYREDVHIRQTAYIEADGEVDTLGPVGIAVDARPRRMTSKDSVAACVSSWCRISDHSMPPRIKASANYQNGRLAMVQAKLDGYDCPLLLNSQGKVSEAPGACCFIVREGVALTPPVTADILESITRASLVELFGSVLGVRVIERDLDRTELYIADEVFLCGTAWEIMPVTSIDRLTIGTGTVGAVTETVRKVYSRVVRGEDETYRRWLTPVYKASGPEKDGR